MIVLVTDTSTGYTFAEAANRQVKLIPLHYFIEDKQILESARGDNGNFIDAMKGKICKTSQPSYERVKMLFSSLVSEGNDVICLTMSAALSDTFSLCERAAKDAGGNISVFDSETIASGLVMLVDEAVNMVAAGQDCNTILANLQESKNNITTLFTVSDPTRLIDGGKLSKTESDKMAPNKRTMFSCKGGLHFEQSVPEDKDMVSELDKRVPNNIRRMFIMRCGSVDISELFSTLHDRFPNTKIHIRDVSPVVSCNVGVGAFGIAFIERLIERFSDGI